MTGVEELFNCGVWLDEKLFGIVSVVEDGIDDDSADDTVSCEEVLIHKSSMAAGTIDEALRSFGSSTFNSSMTGFAGRLVRFNWTLDILFSALQK